MKPSTRHVLELLLNNPDGLCAVDFLNQSRPVLRPAARVYELKHEHDWWIDVSPCKKHRHDGRAVKYSVFQGDAR